ncbi:GNAT family N-acetyltransferase [bacterium]|nr:GNAT family N-acetyltransferase [bacterium]
MSEFESVFRDAPQIDTERLILRGIEEADLAEVLPVTVYDGLQAQSEKEARMMLERIAEDQRFGHTIHWGIALKATNRIIGTCGFYRGFWRQVGEIGYILKPEFRRQGLMFEAIDAMIRYGFDGLQLNRIDAFTRHDNIASVGLLKKLGFNKGYISRNGFQQFSKSSQKPPPDRERQE